MASVVALTAIGAKAQAQLSITPITWDVIGLDSNNVNSGPNQYLVGVRVSNVGTTPASAVMAQFVWDSANASINLSGNTMVAIGTLAPNAHADAFFNVVITRRTQARGAMRSYHITASATGLPSVSTPAGRRVYVEKLVSQNRNGVDSFSGPTTVILGQEYTYNVVSHTATQGYEQLEEFANWPSNMFQILSVTRTYTAPSSSTSDRLYGDACGWDQVNRICAGPATVAGGKVGGNLTTTYKVRVIGTGTATITNLIYDFSGSSYHYNSDLGTGINSMTITVVSDGTISGHLFGDSNGDGIQNAGEPDWAGVSVLITDQNGKTYTVVTDASGNYSQVAAVGSVTADIVTSTLPAGSFCTTGNAHQVVTVNGAATTLTSPVGFQQRGALSGIVFNDVNGNGAQDTGEPALSGVTVKVTDALGAIHPVQSDANGSYSLTLVVGQASVDVDEATLPVGSVRTAGSDPQTVNVAGAANTAVAPVGYQQQGSVSGHVFNDVNGNGTQDSAEPSLSGVSVEITDALGQKRTVYTVASGSYNVSGLAVGSTAIDVVQSTLPAGSACTTGNAHQAVTVSGAATTATGAVGYQQRGSVSGRVFSDVNGNGMQDAGEPGLSGVTVNVTDALGVVHPVQTNVGGDYSLAVVKGTTNVDVVEGTLPAGSVRTAGADPQSVNVTEAANAVTVAIGYQQQGSVSGHIFSDVNGNSSQDGTEPNLPGVSVEITDSLGLKHTVSSDASGNYSVSGLPVGNAVADVLESTLPAGSVLTGGSDPQTVSVREAQSSVFASVGYQQRGTLSGRVFCDVNGNGTQDAGETGLSGVTLNVTDALGVSHQTHTNASGDYSLEVVAGSTGVDVDEATVPSSSVLTAGSDPQSVTVSGGATASAAAVGYQQRGSVSGRVFNDVNGNGTQDAGEPGLAGVTVRVSDVFGAVHSVQTDANGDYSVSLPAGSATADVEDATLPSGYFKTAGTDSQSVMVMAAANIAAGAVGYQPPAPPNAESWTVGYEDQLGPAPNDWDYNDFLVLTASRESFAGSNLSRIELSIEAAARGATIQNAFYQRIRLAGNWSARLEIYADRNSSSPLSVQNLSGTGEFRALVWNSTTDALPPAPGLWSTNTAVGQTVPVLGQVARLTIDVLEPGLNPGSARERAPYDPYLKSKNGEIHLIREGYPSSTEVVAQHPNSRLNGFNLDFAFAFPSGSFTWARECRQVWDAYPRFDEYVLSGNSQEKDWYDPSRRNRSETWNYYKFSSSPSGSSALMRSVAEAPSGASAAMQLVGSVGSPIVGGLNTIGDSVSSVTRKALVCGTMNQVCSLEGGSSFSLALNCARSRPVVTRLAEGGPMLLISAEERYDGKAAIEARLWPTGELQWRTEVGAAVKSALVVASLDGSANKVVLAVTDNAQLYALKADGSQAFAPVTLGTSRVESKNLLFSASPVVADINADGAREIIVASCADTLHVLSGLGAEISGWPVRIGAPVSASPIIARDPVHGQARILVGTREGKLLCYDALGHLVSGFPRELGGAVLASPALFADGADGHEWTVWATMTGTVTVMDAQGAVHPGWPLSTEGLVMASPVVGDINGDSLPEIVVSSMSGGLYAWSTSGVAVEGFPTQLVGAVQSTPLIGDLDGNGHAEIWVGTALGELWRWDSQQSSAQGAPLPWAMATGSVTGDAFAMQSYSAPGTAAGVSDWSIY